MTIENEELSDDQLFNDSVSDETPETPVVTEQIEQPKEEVVSEKTDEVVAKVEDDLDAELVADKAAGKLPSDRIKQLADQRRQLENDLANERADKAALRQRLEALEKPAPKAEEAKAAKPDPLLDPEGYDAYMEAKVETRLQNSHREMDLRLTRQSNAELFDKAYGESQRLKDARDPAFLELSQKMQTTNSPGKLLLDWYQDRTTRAEVGTDLNAYKQRLRDEALKDPEFRKAAMEAWRAEAPTHTNGRPNVQLAPSLSGASRANAALRSSNDDVSDSELFELTTG